MGLSCFSKPTVASDEVCQRVKRPAGRGGEAVSSDCAQPDPLSTAAYSQRAQSLQLSPSRSGLSATAAIAVAAVPALDMSIVAAAGTTPVRQLSARLLGLLSSLAAGESDGGHALSGASSVSSFLSARSDLASEAGSWVSAAAAAAAAAAGIAKHPSAGSARSYSGGHVPVLDSVSSIEDDVIAEHSQLDALGRLSGISLPLRTASLLRATASEYNAGKLLAAEVLARRAAAAAGTTLERLAGAAAEAAAAEKELESSAAAVSAAQSAAALGLDLGALVEEAAAARECLVQLAATRGWTSSREGGLKVLYHHDRAASTVHSVRVEAEYDWPADRLLSVAREFDVVGSFNRFAQDHSVLAEPSVFESIVYAGTWMPFPMKPLELVLSVRWTDVIEEEGVILIVLSDAAEKLAAIPGAKPLPQKSASRRRGHMLPGSCGYMRPLPPGPDGRPRTKCVIMAHLDTGIAYIPGFVVSFVLKVLSPFLFAATKRLLRESFADEDAELPRRIAAKPHLYGLVRQAEACGVAAAARADNMLRTLSHRSDASQRRW